ncbi:hypothetical protein J5500_01950 [Candidatus Saccharibacteria bacterium]|nr:hypothetical protein [Candidatus Saccharibacteria bacterium]
MKSSSILRGLNGPSADPSTMIEVYGPIYFHRNPHSNNYSIETVVIEDGRLCVYYDTNVDMLPERLAAAKHNYVKVSPSRAVQLVIKEHEPVESGSTHVAYYVVCCLNTPARGDYFRFRKYEADLDWPFCENISCNTDDQHLIEKGFVCTEEIDDDGKSSFVVYHKKG